MHEEEDGAVEEEEEEEDCLEGESLSIKTSRITFFGVFSHFA